MIGLGYYLLEHANPYGPHFYTSRRNPILAVVVHITAGLEDLDATDDHSAERTARYAATTERSVSWHSGSDTDSAFDLLPDSYTAFHVRGYNSSTLGHEISKKHTNWRTVSRRFRDATLLQAARHLGPKAQRNGIPIRKATKAELDRAIRNGGPPVGFIGHTELDPSRRTDPGVISTGENTFPWHEFLELTRLGADLTRPDEEHDMAPHVERILAGYRRVRGDTYEPRIKDPSGWDHWMEKLQTARNADERNGVVHLCLALLAHEAGL